jgi:hypothetical protein
MMKKMVLAIAFTGACFTTLHAQSIDDALRYSSSTLSGSARGQAVGGALGSLGGEPTSIYVNPASVAFFKTSDFSFAIDFQNITNKGSYLNSSGSDNKFAPNISNVTLIFGGKRKKPGSKWENFSFAMGVNRTNNYNEREYYQGVNNSSSLSLNYATAANAANITDPQSQLGNDPSKNIPYLAHTAIPAYQSYIISPFVDGNGVYTSGFYAAAQATDSSIKVRQENIADNKGSATDLSLAFGANYNNVLYIGGSANFPIMHFEQALTWKETNVNSVAADLNYSSVTQYLSTNGSGFKGQLGVIVKPVRALNLGVSFATPSWLTFTDHYHTDMIADTKTGGVKEASSTQSNNGYEDESKYTITTPWKGTVSATWLFAPSADTRKPTGFITADYEYVDYSAMKMRFKNGYDTDTEDSNDRNQLIKDTYKGASNFRIGGELKLHTIAFRLGYANYGSPYKDAKWDGARSFYTGGIGYRNRGFYCDLALVYGTGTRVEQPYTLDDTSYYQNPPTASIKTSNTNVLMTFGWKF